MNEKAMESGAVQVHLHLLPGRGVRFRVSTSPPLQLPLFFCLVAGGSLVDLVTGSLVARKNQSKWRPAGSLRALVEHPASRPLGVD